MSNIKPPTTYFKRNIGTFSIYAAVNFKDGKKVLTPYTMASKAISSDFCKRVILGVYYSLEQRKTPLDELLRVLNSNNIKTSKDTVSRLRSGFFSHTNTLVLSFFAHYFNTSLIDLYFLGDDVIKGVRELKRFKM